MGAVIGAGGDTRPDFLMALLGGLAFRLFGGVVTGLGMVCLVVFLWGGVAVVKVFAMVYVY